MKCSRRQAGCCFVKTDALCAVSKLAACHVQTQTHMLGVADINVGQPCTKLMHQAGVDGTTASSWSPAGQMQAHCKIPFDINILPMHSLSQAAITLLQKTVQTAVSPLALQCCHARQLLQAAAHCLLPGTCAARALHAVVVLLSTSSAWRRTPGEPHTTLSRRQLCSVCGRQQSAQIA